MTLQERIQSASRTVFLGVGIGLAAFYYFTSYDSGEAIDVQIAAINQDINKNQSDLEKAQKVANEKGRFQEEVNVVSNQLKTALELLPTKMKAEEVLDKISTEAQSAGVKLRLSTPKNPEAKGFYDELPIDVEIEGSYSNLTQFLSYISSRRIQRIINLKNLEFTTKNEIDSVMMIKMTGTLVAYRYVEVPTK